MTAQARDRIAAALVKRMREANKWHRTSTPDELAAVAYLSGAAMVLLEADIPYRTAWDADARRYTSLTLDGVTYPV